MYYAVENIRLFIQNTGYTRSIYNVINKLMVWYKHMTQFSPNSNSKIKWNVITKYQIRNVLFSFIALLSWTLLNPNRHRESFWNKYEMKQPVRFPFCVCFIQLFDMLRSKQNIPTSPNLRPPASDRERSAIPFSFSKYISCNPFEREEKDSRVGEAFTRNLLDYTNIRLYNTNPLGEGPYGAPQADLLSTSCLCRNINI